MDEKTLSKDQLLALADILRTVLVSYSTDGMFSQQIQQFINDVGIGDLVFAKSVTAESLPEPMVWEHVSSSRVSAIRYDEERKTILTKFPDGKVWAYMDCEESDWQSFRNAQSLGSHISKHLNNKPHGQFMENIEVVAGTGI